MSTGTDKDRPAQAAPAPAAAAQSPTKPAEVEEEFPDPDEDDLDDLDDMLDEFSAVKLNKKPEDAASTAAPAPAPSNPGPASAAAAAKSAAAPTLGPEPATDENFSEEDFAKQLQAGMADLLGELDSNPEMQAQFEDIFKQINAAAADAEGGPSDGAPSTGKTASPPAPQAASVPDPASGPDPAAGDASFQDTIRATMERMQNSGDQATAAATSGTGGADDFMAEMLKSLGSGDFNPGAGGGEDSEDFSKMLMGMMEQLTNKEILYEPMKELHDKFPEWMEKNKATTPEADLKRYEEQKTLVAQIVGKFEEPTYKDSNSDDRTYIVDRMQKMQAQGSPPADLVGDMASAQDAFAGADDQCNPQ